MAVPQEAGTGRRDDDRGHDPLLGRSRSQLRRELATWLLASGRYRLYFGEVPPVAEERAAWEASASAKLEAEGAWEHELMHWYAARRLSAYP